MAKLIFVAEDDEGIREVYECAFDSNGYVIKSFATAEEMFECLKDENPDIIILDIMLPVMDGLTALKALKESTKTAQIPVILISARSEEHIKVRALTNGAEDYMTKPFGVMELVARVNNILKRNDNQCLKLSYKDISVDMQKFKILLGENKLDLSPKCYEIIKYLISKQGAVVTRDELFDNVWGEQYFPEARTLDIHINAIRQEIAKYTDEKYISTVRGVGFIIGE